MGSCPFGKSTALVFSANSGSVVGEDGYGREATLPWEEKLSWKIWKRKIERYGDTENPYKRMWSDGLRSGDRV